MCDFISWIESNGEVLYLTDKEVFSKFGKEILAGTQHNDVLGHGAIRAFYNIKGGNEREVRDFWNVEKLPKEIAAKIAEFDRHWGKMFKSGNFQCDDLIYIAQNGPEEWRVEQPLDPPKTCDEDGHVPVFLGEADGIDFYRCRRCGAEWEV